MVTKGLEVTFFSYTPLLQDNGDVPPPFWSSPLDAVASVPPRSLTLLFSLAVDLLVEKF